MRSTHKDTTSSIFSNRVIYILSVCFLHTMTITAQINSLKVDTIQNRFLHELHVIHERWDYFGNHYIYSLPEQETHLKLDYDGKDESGSMSWEHNKDIEKDLLAIRHSARNTVLSMKKRKLLKLKHRLSITIMYNPRGDIILVNVTSGCPLHRKMGHSNIKRLIQNVSTYKLHKTSVKNQRLYYRAIISLF